jgi:hypothetical protein
LGSGFVVAGFEAGAASAVVSLGAAAGFGAAGLGAAGFAAAGAGAGVAASAPAAELEVPADVPGEVVGAGVGVTAVSSAGGVDVGASAVPVAVVPLSGTAVPVTVPLPGPLLLVDVVEPGVAETSATATPALLRLVSATAKTAPTKTRPNPRRERCPPGRSGRCRPTLRTAARGEPSHKKSSALRRPKLDRLSQCIRTGCPVEKRW